MGPQPIPFQLAGGPKRDWVGDPTRSRFNRLTALTRIDLEPQPNPNSTSRRPKTGPGWDPSPIPFQPADGPKEAWRGTADQSRFNQRAAQKREWVGAPIRSHFNQLTALRRLGLEPQPSPVSTGPRPKTGLGWDPNPYQCTPKFPEKLPEIPRENNLINRKRI